MTTEANTISILNLKGVGAKCAEALARLNISTAQDLLFHLPSRYEDRTEIKKISTLRVGDRVLIEGAIKSTKLFGSRNFLRATLVDHLGDQIDLIFFHFTHVHQKKLSTPNLLIRCFGEVRESHLGQLEMTHPEYTSTAYIPKDSFLVPTDRLSPVYPTTKGLMQKKLRDLVQQAFKLFLDTNQLVELLPEKILKKYSFGNIIDALQFIHFPPAQIDLNKLILNQYPAQQRLVFEELLAHQISLRQLRRHVRSYSGVAFKSDFLLEKKLKKILPFQLTGAQEKVILEIKQDLLEKIPMLRLIQGDVGSGKTIVACFAALQAIEAGFQVALMVPTEILAQQHYQQFQTWFKTLTISVDCLVSRQSATEQKNILSKLNSGEIHLIIGTHALFQKQVEFKNLALLIIDEQHRFGVEQRLALAQKALKTGKFPHQLIMTATPIPRTLMMSAYADLDCSIIDELPPGRKPIQTILISQERRSEVIARVKINCQMKKQAYWICTLINESEALECEAAEKTAVELKKLLPELKIDLVHGKLASPEKNKIMQQYRQGDIDLLVATTVIEVGVDVPNASLMIIENPERLGLAQLHQLRGRIGRGSEASFCVLLFKSPLSYMAKKRLSLMRETQDGFEIAKQDLAMRGPGEVLGVKQSGLIEMRVADLQRDQALLPMAAEVSQSILCDFPEIVSSLIQRWMYSKIKYFNV